MHKAAGLAPEHIVIDLDFVTARQEIDGFVLLVVDVQRRTALRLNVEHEDIESPIRIVAGDLVQQGLSWYGVA